MHTHGLIDGLSSIGLKRLTQYGALKLSLTPLHHNTTDKKVNNSSQKRLGTRSEPCIRLQTKNQSGFQQQRTNQKQKCFFHQHHQLLSYFPTWTSMHVHVHVHVHVTFKHWNNAHEHSDFSSHQGVLTSCCGTTSSTIFYTANDKAPYFMEKLCPKTSVAYINSFHASGTPGRHQWLQSCRLVETLLPAVRFLPQTDGCPSFLKLVNFVTFNSFTGICISRITSSTIFIFIGQLPSMAPLNIGSVSPLHVPPESQSPPLLEEFNTHN